MTKETALRLYYIVFVILLMFCSNSLASMGAREIPWCQTYGTRDRDEGCRLITTRDGGFALIGTIPNPYSEWRNFWLVKTDENGVMQWNYTYGQEWGYEEVVSDAILTNDGGVAIVGRKWQDPPPPQESFDYNSWLVKTDTNGVMQWNYTYGEVGSQEDEQINGMAQCDDGGFILTGINSGIDQNGLLLVKMDSDGHQEWNRTYDDFTGGTDVIQVADGGFVVAGRTRSWTYGKLSFLLMKIDRSGTVQWNQTYGNQAAQVLYAFVQTRDGGFALMGDNSSSYGERPLQIWLIKTDAKGIAEWNQTYDEYDYQHGTALIQTDDGGFALAGFGITGRLEPESVTDDDWDGLLIKTDMTGLVQWTQTYDCGRQEELFDLIQLNDGGFSLLGRALDPRGISYDLWLVRTDASGSPPLCPLNTSTSLNTSGLMISSVVAMCVTLYYVYKRRKGKENISAFLEEN
ncbi:MAG: hypothetical protein ACFFC7_34315 [Candidatus Hermodarchaeota archaeon]